MDTMPAWKSKSASARVRTQAGVSGAGQLASGTGRTGGDQTAEFQQGQKGVVVEALPDRHEVDQ
ncbi:hypothetical protein [Desulfatiferula olefinivorans]